ncbi:MAG: VUT family protein [Alphaproteobacteria bacterium]|nr:VUT family protein [Alphaproteobacteria bacterium]
MREYNTYPKNEIVEVKKPKLYLLTSKAVNLLAVFVACVSVSTFFATRYIGMGDVFFSANAFSTMLAASLLIVILEIYDRKNATKAFMAGAYAILLIFFISAFIPDFNPTPIGYYESSFINYHQKILLCVFVSYVISFLLCIKVYLYMKNELDIPYLWIKATPAIAISQIVYTISYYLIYHGLSNLEYASIDIKNELYLKFFILIVCLLIIYFIISGIKSGFFDLAKNMFPSNDSHYDNHYEDYEPAPIKNVLAEDDDHGMNLTYSKPLYLEDYSARRERRHLPDYSEDYANRSPAHHQDNYYEHEPRQEHSSRGEFEEENTAGSRRNSRRAVSRRESSLNRNRSRPAEESINNDSISRSRVNRGSKYNIGGTRGHQQNGIQFSSQPVSNNLPMQQVGTIGGKPRYRAMSSNTGTTANFGGSHSAITPRSSQSFFVNSLTQNKTNSFSSSNRNSRNNTWNQR